MVTKEKVEFESACLIHYRFSGEKDALLTMFTEKHGLIKLWVKGALAEEGRVPLFKPLLISWQSQGRSLQLIRAELDRKYPTLFKGELSGKYLYSAFYANELVFRFLPEMASECYLFDNYLWLLESLSQRVEIEPLLRVYERQLLISTGLINDLSVDIFTGEPVDVSKDYYCILHPEYGIGVANIARSNSCTVIGQVTGKSLVAYKMLDFSDRSVLKEIKHLMRVVLKILTEGNPLVSRNLFVNYRAINELSNNSS